MFDFTHGSLLEIYMAANQINIPTVVELARVIHG
jgi:hypothetical protein